MDVVGFYTEILVAALDRVPKELVDAALIEGAGPHEISFLIKLPLICDVMGTAVVLWVTNAMKEFSFLYAWGGGGSFPGGQQKLAVYMYSIAFGSPASIYRMGFASAMASCCCRWQRSSSSCSGGWRDVSGLRTDLRGRSWSGNGDASV